MQGQSHLLKFHLMNNHFDPETEKRIAEEVERRVAARLKESELIGNDITEQKRVENELRAEQEKSERQLTQMNAILNQMTEGLVIFDQHGNLLDMNPAALETHGFDSVETLRKHLNELTEIFELFDLQGRQLPVEEWPIGRVLNGETIDSYEVRVRRLDTGKSWFASYGGTSIRDQNGNLLLTIVTLRDITEHKLADEQLLEKEERLRIALEAADLGVWDLDVENDAAHRSLRHDQIFGYDELQPQWGLEIMLRHVLPEDRPIAQEAHRRAAETGVLSYEVRVQWPDGSIHWISPHGRMHYDSEGRPSRITGVVADVTERKQAEEERERLIEDLARSNRELEQFAYIASHDLQTPLRTISSFVNLLARRYQGKLGPEADEYISYAVEGAARMRHLIHDVLEYSRVGSQGKAIQPTDCRAVFDQALANLREEIVESGAKITSDDLPAIPADYSQAVQLFSNLLGNAIKYRKKEEPPRIHISAEQRENDWLFSVRDNGIGFEQQYADRIFQVFQRLHAVGEYPGTGIGLAICKKIVERHGGEIWLESAPGEGTTFFFTFPGKVQ